MLWIDLATTTFCNQGPQKWVILKNSSSISNGSDFLNHKEYCEKLTKLSKQVIK